MALDLPPLRYLDCAALAALLAVRETALARNQQFVITAAVGAPARLLALSATGGLSTSARQRRTSPRSAWRSGPTRMILIPHEGLVRAIRGPIRDYWRNGRR
ncbi:STAS domain-containing protein [Micromonospora taraxaci]